MSQVQLQLQLQQLVTSSHWLNPSSSSHLQSWEIWRCLILFWQSVHFLGRCKNSLARCKNSLGRCKRGNHGCHMMVLPCYYSRLQPLNVRRAFYAILYSLRFVFLTFWVQSSLSRCKRENKSRQLMVFPCYHSKPQPLNSHNWPLGGNFTFLVVLSLPTFWDS